MGAESMRAESMGAVPLGSLVMGYLADVIGEPQTVCLGGLGCIAGTTPIPQFFSDENIGHIMAAAVASQGAPLA